MESTLELRGDPAILRRGRRARVRTRRPFAIVCRWRLHYDGGGPVRRRATRSAVAKIRRLQKTSSPAEIVSVIALVKADQKPGLLSSVRVMTSMLRKEYGDEVNLVTGGVCVGEADPKAKSGSVAVWVRTLGP